MDWPPLSGCAAVNSPDGAFAFVMVNGTLPVSETTNDSVLDDPTATLPKSSDFGATVSFGCPTTASPVSVTDCVVPPAARSRLAVQCPAAVGAKVSGTVTDAP